VKSEIVIAGRNLASGDAVGAYIMGFNPRSIPHIRMASEVGIGPIDLVRITVMVTIQSSKKSFDKK
jgi:uncharacterized protein (DUF362 family)